jgi:hypothetical protein
MPPARLGRKAYGDVEPFLFSDADPWGWHITEYDEFTRLRPGLEIIGRQVVHSLVHLGNGQAAHGIAANKLADNPYWPDALAEHAGRLKHERYLVFLPLSLSRTLDDKGRLRWTLFGGSEQGPARAFWRSFFTAPRRELPAHEALDILGRLIGHAYDLPPEKLSDLHAAGFRILPLEEVPHSWWSEKPLPAWTRRFLLEKRDRLAHVKFLLTFRPFGQLPRPVQRAYLAGNLHLLPFPGSLLFWGAQGYQRLQKELPLALQIPLLHAVARHENPIGIRVPQSGWMHEPRPDHPSPDGHFGPVRNTYHRTHRWARIHRHEDELVTTKEDHLAHVLFSTQSDDLGLYGKPMARNVQIWTHDLHLLLDGPTASQGEIMRTGRTIAEGGLFGYRFLFGAMRVGRHEVYWQRPLVGYWSAQKQEPVIVPNALPGYLTAYPGANFPAGADRLRLDRPVELWPRLLHRPHHQAGIQLFEHHHDGHPYRTALNVRKLLNAGTFFPAGLPRSFAHHLLSGPKHHTLEEWLRALPDQSRDPSAAHRLAEELRRAMEPEPGSRRQRKPLAARTFSHTAQRSFEVCYWNTISALAAGKYVNKDNADCVLDPATQKHLRHHHRDLETLGDYLLDYYRTLIGRQRMTGKAVAGDLPFRWQTDFEYTWMGGWQSNQEGPPRERNLVVVIPGRDRSRAVIMADHYDTAYMEDHYEKDRGGSGARLAAAGADDNHSATVALMLGAEVFLKLSKARRLGCDIWLIHLTGEEFPSDCLGARHLCERLVEGSLQIRLADGRMHDLSQTQVQGVYVLDMVAHNNDHDHDVFQMAPGTGPASLWLAYQAHLAAETWNVLAPAWNRRSSRRGCQRGRRSSDGKTIPSVALHPHLWGEVRPCYDPRSTLFNTDGQIFSDAGVPVVLFMENYDINRTGYHDSHDTMENIDLDYGAGVAAIAIEAVARAACEKPLVFK